jgi:putative ABC transport system substrate-binding protein
MRRRELITLLAGAAAWPVVAGGQQPAIPVVGFLSSLSPESSDGFIDSFRRGLREAGYVDGRNIAIEYRWALGRYERLHGLAAELVGKSVAVLVTTGGDPAALAAKAATSTIPIVFLVGGDPVKLGLVASDNRPTGNATGFNMLTESMEPKRLGILRELLPQVSAIAVLINPKFPPAEMQRKQIEEAASSLNIQIHSFGASTSGEIEAAFESIAKQQIPALIVATDPVFVTHRNILVELAGRHRLPTIYGFRDVAAAGGLLSYGIDLADMYRQQGQYAARVLKGEKVADLPVMQPTKFHLVINLKTARAIGLEVPDRLLALADDVIE